MDLLAKYILVDDDDKVISWAQDTESWANLQNKNSERILMRKSNTVLIYSGLPGTTIPFGDVVQQSDDSTPFETLVEAVTPEFTQEQIQDGAFRTEFRVPARSVDVDGVTASIGSLTKQAVPIGDIGAVTNEKVIVGLTLTNETWKQLPVATDITGYVQAIHDPSNDTFSEDPATDPDDVTAILDNFKVLHIEKVNIYVEARRSPYIGTYVTQRSVDELKREEANLVDGDSSLAGTSSTPSLNEQVVKQTIHDGKALAVAVADEVVTILAAQATWADEAGRTEGIQIEAIVLINAASGMSNVESIYAQFVTDIDSGV